MMMINFWMRYYAPVYGQAALSLLICYAALMGTSRVPRHPNSLPSGSSAMRGR